MKRNIKTKLLSFAVIATLIAALIPPVSFGATEYDYWLVGDKIDGSTESEIHVEYDDTVLDWLVVNGYSEQRYTWFWFGNSDDAVSHGMQPVDPHPLYCIQPSMKGAHWVTGPASNDPTDRTGHFAVYTVPPVKVGDPVYEGIMASGFPTQSVTVLGLSSTAEAYYATKMALWAYLMNAPIAINGKYSTSDPTALAVLAAANKILSDGLLIGQNGGVNEPNIVFKNTSNGPVGPLKENADKSYYETDVLIDANSYLGVSSLQIGKFELEWASAPPDDTTVVTNEDEYTYSGGVITGKDTGVVQYMLAQADSSANATITVKVPYDIVNPIVEAGDEFTLPALTAKALMPVSEFYTAYYKDDPTGYQAYLANGNTKAVIARNTILRASRENEISGIEIVKLDALTGSPVQGAVFEVRNPDGQVIATNHTTGDDGKARIEGLSLLGNYAVTELSPPAGYMPADNKTQFVNVEYNKIATVTFKNDPYGSLRVLKYTTTGFPLSGAVIRIKNIATNTTYTQTTNSAGVAQFSDIRPGAYEIREMSAPLGYVLNTETFTVNVSSGTEGITSFPITNRAMPGLRILKLDRVTGAGVEGVTFEITRDGTFVGQFVTGPGGEILNHNLSPGTYVVTEKAVPVGYVLDPVPQQIELEADDEIRTLIFINDQTPGIHLLKLDSQTFEPLPNAVFLVERIGGGFSKEYTTDENGLIELKQEDNVLPGAYRVREITAPPYYLIDDGVRVIDIPASGNAKFVFTDTRPPELVIVKESSKTNARLPGAAFRIARIEDGSHYLDRVTDQNGEIRISHTEGLVSGVYSVREMIAPAGHVLNPIEYKVQLYPGRTSTLVVPNLERPDLEIIKKDADTGEPLSGVTFKVKRADSSTVTDVTTGADGKAILSHFLNEKPLPGVYEVWETHVPDPYIADADPRLITLFPNMTGTLEFFNHRKSDITVVKLDKITKVPLKNAKFQVWHGGSGASWGMSQDLGFYWTDENGEIGINVVEPGWYRVTEVEAPAGYGTDDPTTIDIFVEPGKNKTITFEDSPKSAIVINKADAVTGELLQGAKFKVSYLSGTSGTGGTVIAEPVTGANGTATVTGLSAGTYVIEETKAPEGYLLDAPAQTVYVTDNEQAVITVEFADTPKGGLIVVKEDSVTGKRLTGASFKVTDETGGVLGNANGVYVTDGNGSFHISEVSGTVIVTETKAPSGYVLDGTPQTVRIKQGETHTLTFGNDPQGGVQVLKLDDKSGNPIQGAEFVVTKMNGERIGTYTTNSLGQISLPLLEAGWYVATETRAAAGYVINSEPVTFEVKDDGKIADIRITNEKESKFLIRKIDSVTKNGIPGVKFLLYDDKGNTLGTYESDQNGYVYIEDGLTDGRYRIQETEAAPGYVLDNQIKTFTVGYGATQSITWENTAEHGQIQVTKKSAAYSPNTALPEGSLLAGAIFEVRDRAGNLADTIETLSNGVATSRLLPLGRYEIREVAAPAFYDINPNTLILEIEFPGQIARGEVRDNPGITGVSVTKKGYREVMPNQEVRWIIEDAANTGTGPLDSFYLRDTLPTDAVRLVKIVTGTWSNEQSYKIVYKTNLSGGEYRTLKDNLVTTKNMTINASSEALGLSAQEYVTEIMFAFGVVPAGFAQVQTPIIYGKSLPWLANAYSFVNKIDIGGLDKGQWIMSNDRWVTKVYAPPGKTNGSGVPTLPRTGY
jgi:uncharacterized surface anchored protein